MRPCAQSLAGEELRDDERSRTLRGGCLLPAVGGVVQQITDEPDERASPVHFRRIVCSA
jgi:hypothetical protein